MEAVFRGVQQKLETAGPALAEVARTYGPTVYEASKKGLQSGIKQGFKSVLNPQKASKYSTYNGISELALAPGNIQEMIQTNL